MKRNTLIQRIGLSLLLMLIALSFWSGNVMAVFAQEPEDSAVIFPDSNLERAIRWAIRKPMGTIYTSDLSRVYNLSVTVNPISDLTGLEHCINLSQLVIKGRNNIIDISPLSGLSNLSLIYLNANSISDISPLTGLTGLEKLQLSNNQISDISPIANLTNLKELDLSRNRINDISPLAGLTKLESLDLHSNKITDILPIISNKWELLQSPINLTGNPLNTTSQNFGIPMLEETGVRVYITRYAFPDWTFIPASLVAWAGLGYAAIYYLTTGRKWKRLRLAALVLGVMGAFLPVFWVLPAFISYASYDVLPIPWGVAITLVVFACLIILAGAVTGQRYELIGGILLIVVGLLIGIVYPLFLFSTWSILTLFPLVSGLLFILSRREKLRYITLESIDKEPGEVQLKKYLPHSLLVSGIVVVGPIGLLAVLFYGLSIAFLQSPTSMEQYIFWLLIEVWCFALTCVILTRRMYW
jgi:hypothetical protein